MASLTQTGILLSIRPLDFVNKENGEEIKGVKVILARPSENPQYDGYGMVVFDLMHIGVEGLSKVPNLVRQSSGLFLRPVNVECDLQMTGKRVKLIPLSIASASAS